ncbi:MAG: PAS domain S-box protein [Betaproteobacteria bacterium]|nr:PAS domain S-box protein [Betaproteobacteria bacterium]
MIQILHVEDDRFDQELVRHALEAEAGEFSVTVACSLEDLRRMLAQPGIECIVSDIHLGGFDGLQVLAIARELSPDVPLIFLTGTGSEEIAVEAIKGGAADYIIKTPAHIIRLPVAIRLAIERTKNELEGRRAAEALRERELRFRALADSTATAIFVYRGERFIFVNKACERISGYSQDDFAAMRFWDFIHPEFRDLARTRGLARQQGESPPARYEVRIVRKDGQERWIDYTAGEIEWQGERAVIGTAVDITESKEAAERLRTSEERFRLVIEKSLTGMYVTRQGRFAYANPRLEALLGYAPGELVGRKTTELVVAEDLPIISAAREKLRSGDASVSYTMRVKRKDGAIIDLGVQGVITEFEGTRAMIGMAQDITERKRAQEQIASYLRQLEASMRGTLRAVANMVELRDPYTAGHQRRVGAAAAAIGRELGMAEDKCRELEMTSLVHDIGKIGIPAEILSKPGALTPIEMQIMKAHPQAGYDILKEVEFAWPLADIVRQHHERLNGSGYPQGLKGGEILLAAQIIGVADVLEAIASHRPYRPSLGIGRALEEIERGRGTLYGAQVVDAALRLFRDKGYTLPQ